MKTLLFASDQNLYLKNKPFTITQINEENVFCEYGLIFFQNLASSYEVEYDKFPLKKDKLNTILYEQGKVLTIVISLVEFNGSYFIMHPEIFPRIELKDELNLSTEILPNNLVTSWRQEGYIINKGTPQEETCDPCDRRVYEVEIPIFKDGNQYINGHIFINPIISSVGDDISFKGPVVAADECQCKKLDFKAFVRYSSIYGSEKDPIPTIPTN